MLTTLSPSANLAMLDSATGIQTHAHNKQTILPRLTSG